MSKHFTGEFHHSLDAKGRVSVPSSFRDQLGGTFWIGRGLDPNCLVIYDEEDWNAFSERLDAIPYNNSRARELVRYFQTGTMKVEIDRQGRILLSQQLRDYVHIDRNVVFAGNGKRAELWSEEAYNEYSRKLTTKNMQEIADGLLAEGFQI